MSEQMIYDTSSERAAEVGVAVIEYILDGEVENLPLEFRGLNVFGAIASLRKNDDILHGDHSTLDEEQVERLAEIETDIDRALDEGMQYYPFGHKRDVSEGIPLHGYVRNSWRVGVRAKSRRHLLHETLKYERDVTLTHRDFEV